MKNLGVGISTWLILLAFLSSTPVATDTGHGRFAKFTVELFESEIDGSGGRAGDFVAAGHFELGNGSDGVDLMSEDVTILLGRSVLEIPAGSLRLVGSTYTWSGSLDGAPAGFAIDDHGEGEYSFAIAVRGPRFVDPERFLVMLIVGNDGGKALAGRVVERRLALENGIENGLGGKFR